jgi:flavin-dependent dehydrogenase
VLVGDAFGFIDPVYSSGVFLALKSGELAADAIHESLNTRDFSAESLGRWQAEYVRGLEMFRKLVYAFYTPEFSFAQFLKKHPEFKGHLVDILIGNVFRPGLSDMFEAMGDVAPPEMAAT